MSANQHTIFADQAQCLAAKELYDSAFNKWYAHTFLPGKGAVREMCCKEEFQLYHTCTQDYVISNGLEFKIKRVEAKLLKQEDHK